MDIESDKIEANVFVIHTPFQRMIVQHMLKTIPTLAECDNYLVLDMDIEGLTIERDLFKDIVFLNPPIGRYKIGSGKNCRRSRKAVWEICRSYGRAGLFFTDIIWPINNALFGWIMKQKKRKVIYCNFPDGFGNLLLKYPTTKRRIRNLIKVGGSLFGALPYFDFSCDLAGLEKADQIYSMLPSAMPEGLSGEIIEIPKMIPTEENPVPDSMLFLGQPYDYLMTPENYADLAAKTRDYLLEQGCQKYFYKSHHFAKSDIEKNIFLEAGFELIDERRPIEELFLERQFSGVASYNSSGLVSLKILFGDRVRCISCFNDLAMSYTVEGKSDFDEVLRIFNLVGVERHN